MRTSIILFSLLTLVSCGKDLKRMIGANYDNRITKVENRVKTLEEQVKELESKVSQNIGEIETLTLEIEELAANQAENASLINSLTIVVDTLQNAVNDNLARIVELESQDTIVDYFDPCGNGAGFDEIILRTKSGKYIAYFESGNNRFLTVLTSGNFRTTDSQACNFTI